MPASTLIKRTLCTTVLLFLLWTTVALGETYYGYNVQVPIDSYSSFRNAVNGNGYNVDYDEWGCQCWDGASLLWYKATGNTLITRPGGNGAARDCWEISRQQNIENSGGKFMLIYNKEDIERGDIIVFKDPDPEKPGHIGFADEDYKTGTNQIELLAQNQGNNAGSSGKPFSIMSYPLSNFLGAFRYKNWDTKPPTILSEEVKAINITSAGFMLQFKVKDNVGVTSVYADIYPETRSKTPSRISGTYDKASQTASISVSLSENVGVLCENYTFICIVTDQKKNGPAHISSTSPVSIFEVDSSYAGKYYTIHSADVLACPQEVFNDSNQSIYTLVDGVEVEVFGLVVNNGISYYRIGKNRWVYAWDVIKSERPLSPWIQAVLYALQRYVRFGFGTDGYSSDAQFDSITMTGKISTEFAYPLSSPEAAEMMQLAEAFVPQENNDYSVKLSTRGDEVVASIEEYVGPGGDVVIPETIGDVPVVSIANGAF